MKGKVRVDPSVRVVSKTIGGGLSPRQERQRLKTLQKKFLNGGLNDKSELISLAIKNANQKG